jgi:nucleoside-diphosphate-sugar epimerase
MLLALTGSTGFIGRHLLRELPKRGYRLRVLLRRPTSLPTNTASAVIGDIARPQNMAAALQDVDAVIHSAGLAHAMSGIPEDDYRVINTEATINLARAAKRAGAKRFVFLSSIRAQCGPSADSKLAAERGLAELDIDWVALRATLAYGPGVKGNMAELMRLARLPWPLPLGGLRARRSLLAVENLLAAVETVLTTPQALRRPLIVADPLAVTVADMIAAMRGGLGRRPGVFSVPPALLALSFHAAGKDYVYERLSGALVADPSALMGLGWKPPLTSEAGLAQLMQMPGEL